VRRVIRGIALAVVAVIVAGMTATFLPPVVWPDAPAPASLATAIPAARWRLWTKATDGLRLPLHLTFLEARCGSDGSVGLVFEEHRPPYTERRFAYVVRGSMPTSADDSWDGGYGIAGSVLEDDEFVHVLGPDHQPCPG
jgi:hypothetical protein